MLNVLFSDASRSPPPGPVSERRARRPPRRTHIGTSQSTHNGTAVAKALAAEAHNPATGAHLSSQLERASGGGGSRLLPDAPWRSTRRRWSIHDGLSFAEHVLAARPRVAEERSLVALVSSMADYRSEGEYDQTELARAGQHSNSTVLLLERRSDTPRVGELHRKADDRVVSKKIEFKGMGERDQLQLEREVSCLKRCHHAHIVTYHGAFAAEGTLHIITEYCGGGSLADRIKTHQADGAPFASARVATWLRQLVGALSHVHALGLLHRDVKSSNVFLTAAGMIKLGDFGLADKLAGADRSSDGERGRLWCGTPCYLSPEEVRQEAYGAPSDVWALGVVAYELLTLRRPFRAGSVRALFAKITGEDFSDHGAALDAAPHPPLLRALAADDAMLHPDATKRSTLADLRASLDDDGYKLGVRAVVPIARSSSDGAAALDAAAAAAPWQMRRQVSTQELAASALSAKGSSTSLVSAGGSEERGRCSSNGSLADKARSGGRGGANSSNGSLVSAGGSAPTTPQMPTGANPWEHMASGAPAVPSAAPAVPIAAIAAAAELELPEALEARLEVVAERAAAAAGAGGGGAAADDARGGAHRFGGSDSLCFDLSL